MSRELLRKGVHALSLILLPISFSYATLIPWLMLTLCVAYWGLEAMSRQQRIPSWLQSFLEHCKRPGTEQNIDPGPYYLAAGIGLSFLFLPLAAAQVGLIHISLADATASLAGHYLPAQERIPYASNKSVVGSSTYFVTAFLGSLFFLNWWQAFIVAVVGTVIESLPMKDMDNLTVPLGIAFFITLMGWV